MGEDIEKYDSVLVAVEFKSSIDKVQSVLDRSNLLKNKQYALGISSVNIKKVNINETAEVVVSLDRIHFRDNKSAIGGVDELVEIMNELNSARNSIINTDQDEVLLCGAVFGKSFDIEDDRDENIEKIFNLKNIEQEGRIFNYKSADGKYNYNISMNLRHDHKKISTKKILTVVLDVNNVHQEGPKNISQLGDIIHEIESSMSSKEKFMAFISNNIK